MPSPSPSPAPELRRIFWTGAALAGIIVLAYLTSFPGVMVFDDLYAIADNPTIRDLRRLDEVLVPGAEGGSVAGRPVLNLTLALNHAISGLSPGSYHAVNLAIHVAAALALFGLIRRTLEIIERHRAQPDSATPRSAPLTLSYITALTIAALWALHPLQTESVTYIIQRAESLCGLFYLLTLYCFVRGAAPALGATTMRGVSHADISRPKPSAYKTPPTPHSKPWLSLSFLCCLLGMGTKEVMVTAPVMVLLYDRTFIAGSWREAWRRRRSFHGALMATWLLLVILVVSTENRGGSAGFNTVITWWPYLLTQCHAIVHYLRLAFWPDPLVFDYGTPLFTLDQSLPQALLLVALLGVTLWALVRKPIHGFIGAWFFLTLAPSSSIVPIATQTMAEHRMYLPLAAVMVVALVALRIVFGPARAAIFGLGIALAAAGLTAARNCDYHSELALWTDTVAHRPQNPRAHTNLGIALAANGRYEEAISHFQDSLRLQPRDAASLLNLCEVLTAAGRAAEAVAPGEEAVHIEPQSVKARLSLARALVQLGRNADAAMHCEAALKIQPAAAEIANWLGEIRLALGGEAVRRGDLKAATTYFRKSLEVAPGNIAARANLANALLVTGQVDAAIAEYRDVLRRQPGAPGVQENLNRAREIQSTRR